MQNLWKGIVAGFAATIVLSLLMLIKSAMGLMPELNVIAMLTRLMGASSPAAGWIAHFAIGTVLWGGLFAWLDPQISGQSHWLKGVIFATGAWLLMMIFVMPGAGAGFFGLNLGIMAAVMTLVLHIVFGAVLGGVYGLERPAAHGDLSVASR
jgi:hypothetical protein